MLPDGRRVGTHLPLADGMVRAADRAAAIGASAVQVFIDNPTSWRRRPSLPRELTAFRERLAIHDVAPLAIHAPYLVNLAGPEGPFLEHSVNVLANELRVAEAWGASFVNVHIGSHRGDGIDAGAARLTRGLREVLERLDGAAHGVMLVLENGAGGGFGLGSTIEELALIDRSLEAEGIDPGRIGFCLDTAHLWGAGYRIDAPTAVDDVLGKVEEELGLGRVRMVHLNDSRSDLGSRSDRHEHVGAGSIGADGLRRFLEHPALGHAVYYLETPGMSEGWDEVNMARVRDILAGRPLPELPPEAFETRNARGRGAPAEEGEPAVGRVDEEGVR